MSHHGESLQEAIKQSGVPISRIVQELGITRPTIYRKFREETLDESFVKRVGEIIGRPVTISGDSKQPSSVTHEKKIVTHSSDPTATTTPDQVNELISLQRKYIKLLEEHNALLIRFYGNR